MCKVCWNHNVTTLYRAIRDWGKKEMMKWRNEEMNDRVSGPTTGPILMPFCIRTKYWSPTWLGVFFSKISKYGNNAHTYAYRVQILSYIYIGWSVAESLNHWFECMTLYDNPRPTPMLDVQCTTKQFLVQRCFTNNNKNKDFNKLAQTADSW